MSGPMKAMPGMTFGADPELFLFDHNIQKFISPDGLIPGTKEEPFKVSNGAVQQDGMAAEFNIDPAESLAEFRNNIEMVLVSLKSMLPKGVELVSRPAVVFDEDVWEKATDKAKELGCSPDYNAWTGSVNPPPNPKKASSPRLRTASGHLHIGWTSDMDSSCIEHVGHCTDLVKQLDWYLGPWSISVDSDPTRRELYGKAGAMRIKSYGVEYRVLSNFWVMNPTAMRTMWDRMQSAIWSMRQGPKAEQVSPDENAFLIKMISDSKLDNTFAIMHSNPIIKFFSKPSMMA